MKKNIYLLFLLFISGCLNQSPKPYRQLFGKWEIEYIGVNGIDKTYLFDSLNIVYYEFYEDESPSATTGRYRMAAYINHYIVRFDTSYSYFGCGITDTKPSVLDSVSFPLFGLLFAELDTSDSVNTRRWEVWTVNYFNSKNMYLTTDFNSNLYENRFRKII